MTDFQSWIEARRTVLAAQFASARRIPITVIIDGARTPGLMSEGQEHFVHITEKIFSRQYRGA